MSEHVITKADALAVELGYHFDPEQADRVIRFTERYVTPQTTGRTLTLLPWQRSFLSRLYGWRDRDGRRRFRTAIVSTGKKNGKTLITSAVSLFELMGAGVPSPLVVSASTTRENASQVFAELHHSIKANRKLNALVKPVPSWKLLRVPSRNGEYRSLSSDAGAAEGLNASAVILDECHAHRGDSLYRSLQYATIARHGLTVAISTAGRDQSHWWFALDRKARAILRGDDLDTSTLPLIYSADPEDPFDSVDTWRKANPSLGVSFSEADFRQQFEEAKKTTADLLSFRRYRLNSWCADADCWLSLDDWDKCKATISEDVLRQCPMWLGLDCAMTTDLSAICQVFYLGDRKFYVRGHAWVTKDGAERRNKTNLPAYDQFRRQGELTITEGDEADQNAMREYVERLRKTYKVKMAVFDMFNGYNLARELTSRGLEIERMPQGYAAMTYPVKEFERAVKEGRILHDGSNLMRWKVQNCTLDVDAYGNCRLSRKRSRDKIDMLIAAVQGFSQALPLAADVVKKPSVYATRPPIRF